MVDVWWRNPELYVRDIIEHDRANVIFDPGFIVRRRIDPLRFMDLFVQAPMEYRLWLPDRNGTPEYRRGDIQGVPSAVYPTWDYEVDDIVTLEEMCETEPDEDACSDDRVPLPERPVFGQAHVVVVRNFPPLTTGIGRRLIATLVTIQEDFPNATIHVSGMTSFRFMFGTGFKSIDYDPYDTAKKKLISLPNGKPVKVGEAARFAKWITLLGYKPVQLDVPRNLTVYNMKSALWAADNFRENIKFRSRGHFAVDPDAVQHIPAVTKSVMSRLIPAQTGDKLLCDTCSLAPACKYFRDGEVCSLPASETASLAKLFGSRDPDKVLDGLGALMEANSERLEKAMHEEEISGGKDGPLDPEITKLINTLFGNGVKLAKLLAPQRFTVGTKIALNVNGTQGSISQSPQQAVAEIVRHFEAQGISADKITPKMVETLLARANAIDVPALDAGDD